MLAYTMWHRCYVALRCFQTMTLMLFNISVEARCK